jgi:RNA polymerase sigma-70 factor (ECF subfamily)
MRGQDTSIGGPSVNFADTAWGMVERARDASPQIRQVGLEELARKYWKPVYHYLRVAWAKSNEDAKDLAQAFFLWLADGRALDRYAPERASFRTFLKSLLRHFVQHHEEAVDRLKRGGGQTFLRIDDAAAPLAGIVPDPKVASPDDAFEREWRQSLMARAVERVRRQLQSQGDEVKFRIFERYYLNGDANAEPTYAAIAEELRLKEGEVKHALSDVREEVRKEIRAELAQTVSRPEDLQEEWNAFFSG